MRIGVMSFAHVHATGYVAVLQQLGVEVLAADPDAEAAGRQSPVIDGMQLVDSYQALLSGCDGVVICAETSEHRRLTELAAAAGVYVLCEKPLALSLADGQAMIDACTAAGVGLMTAFPMRFASQVRRLAAMVHGGELGVLVAMAGSNPGSCPGGWFTDPALSGGGSVIDHTVHLADLMCWLSGQRPLSVYAQMNALVTPELGVETGGLIQLTFDGGLIGSIDASWSRLPHYPVWGGLTLEVVGDAGVVSVDPFGEQLLVSSDRTRLLRFGANANRAMLIEFLSAIRATRMPSPDGRDGLLATAVALAAYRADHDNTVTDVWPASLPATSNGPATPNGGHHA